MTPLGPSRNPARIARGLPGPADPHCRDCLEKLIGMTARLASGKDQALAGRTMDMARNMLDGLDPGSANNCEASGILQKTIRRQTGDMDPFKEYKRREIAAARDFMDGLDPERLGDPEFCLKLAALGNSLDFFRDSAEALAESAPMLGREDFFFHEDLAKLRGLLEKGPKLFLFLSDNAGEFLLDLPLLAHFTEKARRVVAVVKGGPCGNDLTKNDLEFVPGIDNAIKFADTGAAQPGAPGAEASPEFHALLNRADLVIAKGMANFETLYGARLESPVLFLFQIKCRPMEAMLNGPRGAFWALWQGPAVRNASTETGKPQPNPSPSGV